MPRPPLPIGTYGTISVFPATGGGFRAVAKFRDVDGVTRKVGRVGPTSAAAKNRLREHFRDRAQQGPATGLNGDTRFRVAAEQWIESVDRLAEQGARSPTTAQLYRLILTTHVLTGLGELRLREVTVPRLDHFIQTLHTRRGIATAKVARTVASGVLGLAVRHGAIPSNPMRDISRIVGQRQQPPRALTAEERGEWIERLRSDPEPAARTCPTCANTCSAPVCGSARRWP